MFYKGYKKPLSIFRIMLLVLMLLFFLTGNTVILAHLPKANEVDPETYQPTLGWVELMEGDIIVTDVEGKKVDLNVGEAIKGDCIIETGEESRIVIKLEDFEEHQSVMTIDYNSKISFDLSEGKHYNDTIKPHGWYIDRHSVTLNMETGHLYVKLNVSGSDEYDIEISTPNTLIHNTLGWKEQVDFFISVEKDLTPGDVDMTDEMQSFFAQMQQMAGEQVDEETQQEFAEFAENYNENLNSAMDYGYEVDEHGITTVLDVYTGEAQIRTNTVAGSSDNLLVTGGHSVIVDGINQPLLDGEESNSTNNDKVQSKPTLDLNIEINESKFKPKLAESVRTQLDIATSEDDEYGMPGVPPEMLKTDIWIYEVAGDPKTLLEDTYWPRDTRKMVEQKDMGEEIFNLLDNFGYALEGVWGDDWSIKAETVAEEYMGKDFTSVTYSYMIPGVKSYTVNVVSSFLDPRTLEVYEGTYLMVIELEMDYGF
ncbi:MAG: hypothetical protein ACOCRZ_07615 [Halothermotrichaceae bacterium]